MAVRKCCRRYLDVRKRIGSDVKLNIRLPILGCTGPDRRWENWQYITPPKKGLPYGCHDWSMPLNCGTHDYAHIVGIACWRCSRQEFFYSKHCWKNRDNLLADLHKQLGYHNMLWRKEQERKKICQ